MVVLSGSSHSLQRTALPVGNYQVRNRTRCATVPTMSRTVTWPADRAHARGVPVRHRRTCGGTTGAVRVVAETMSDPLDAYSRVVTTVAAKLRPSVAALAVRGPRGEGAGSAVVFTS